MEALGTYQGLARATANSTSEVQKVEGIPESPLQAVTQRQPCLLAQWRPKQIASCWSQTALLKANNPLTSECPAFQKREKKEGVSVLSRGCWENLQGVERGGGSGHLEPPQTLPATLGSQNSGNFWPQALFSFLLPGPAKLWPLGRVGQP